MSNVKLNPTQLSIIDQLNLNTPLNTIEAILPHSVSSSTLDMLLVDDLIIALKILNALYRAGVPWVNDEVYDTYIAQLKKIAPEMIAINLRPFMI